MASVRSRRVLLAAIVGCSVAAAAAGWYVRGRCFDLRTTVYVVRHAEKQSPKEAKDAKDAAAAKEAKRDPPLTELGKKRAEALAKALEGTEIKTIYSTQYKRTRDTVAPTARVKKIAIEVVDARDLRALIRKICACRGGAVLVSGHSNTVPQIIDKLGVSEQVTLADGDYGDLFVVRPSESGPTLERRRFDPG